ncbi:MAG: valine--tRNA ligase [Bacteriovoracaceae bacterium]
MTQEISKTFESKSVESKWYETWEKGKYFKPKAGKKGKDPYCIIMPPPNVTGILHAGHALDVSTQDALIRFKRMKGHESLFLPGMDHAGIATQSVVEKMIWDQEKKTKHDVGREKFLERVWEWKEKHGGIIQSQQKVMGASPDWDYSVFTMDEEANEAVRTFFVKLFNEGLIYQSDYIVNWDTKLQSAISDAEVEHVEVKGAFYHLKYQIKDSDDYLEVATTRPETLLGDTAICVHPEDDRYQKYIGKKAIVPFVNREVEILADEYVDRELGTGCLKVTPGHDFNDFAIGQRHNLEIINIIAPDGKLNENAGEFKGLTVKEARKAVVKGLEEKELLIKIEDHVHSVGHGDRSKTVIEPMVSKQWFLNVQEMAKVAVEAVENDQTKFYPKGWENTYFSWLREPKNWCISRQLWWGHRIPVFYCKSCGHSWASVDEAHSCEKCQSNDIYQDPDVLDTWFSSGLWPMTTLGWPNEERMKEKGFDKFYPTSCLITGFDIIFFWVARMMMMGIKETNKIPFHHVYIHAIVRDKFGKKMSKSLGNGIDPLETVETYGADAFRFTLLAGSGYNRTLNLDPERINGYRNFINKIWNAFRFIAPFLENATDQVEVKKLDHHERWILSELNSTVKIMNDSIEEYRFDDSSSAIYSFVYDKFCSWFIEISKNILYGEDETLKASRASVLKHCFKSIVKLLHPFCPFVTEEIWSHLKTQDEDLLIIQEYPEFNSELEFSDDQKLMNTFIDVVTTIRNLRASVNVKPKEEVEVHLFNDNQEEVKYFEENSKNFFDLARVKTVKVAQKSAQKPTPAIMKAATQSEVYLLLDGVIDIQEHIAKLKKEKEKTEKEVQKFEKKLSNERFVQSAPDDVVAETKEKFQKAKDKLESTEKMIQELS